MATPALALVGAEAMILQLFVAITVVRHENNTHFCFKTGSTIHFRKAPGFVGFWAYHGSTLLAGSKAPDVNKAGIQDIIYYAVLFLGVQNDVIGSANSLTMGYGFWTTKALPTLLRKPKANGRYNAIEAQLTKPGSMYYLDFRSFCENIFQVPLNVAPTKVDGKPLIFFNDIGYTNSHTQFRNNAIS
ncbi:hypothetical protein CGRA01v4_13181 [Colletotrichum graminicola]|uniref:Uncharacterized protein n=1 Tax=Colletotrichum graminicola (strain M1.001 / M2 / FGSC 10212) TaxID=645133 RepID=E3QMA7_COLGM|nr:uncharacterized protein GLRG_07139 [Colletotrichum graminicola M1.001]EFQ31995.1 hypothetical protein GLRG_07139 [Colletotrichum graminicola M1.001]WDK21891.1 hypothetical protein CGRA01v4_13181 [Colletotrichum graminicola]